MPESHKFSVIFKQIVIIDEKVCWLTNLYAFVIIQSISSFWKIYFSYFVLFIALKKKFFRNPHENVIKSLSHFHFN